MHIRKIGVLGLLTTLLAAPGVWAETVNCTPITSLPWVITSQGVYCLTGNLTTNMSSGRAIEIKAHNVTIDLNGWKLGGLAAGPGTSTNGIFADKRKNITIRNGTIRGFMRGILLSDSSPYTTSKGHLIEDIRADRNTLMGMWILGRNNIIRRNQVLDTGGSTLTGPAWGIYIWGPGARALNNDISRTTATSGVAQGLDLRDADGGVAEGNRIDDVSAGSGPAIGLHVLNSTNVVVENNRVNGVSSGDDFASGLHFSSSSDVLAAGNRITSADNGIFYDNSIGKYMENLTSNVTSPFTGGTPVGTNN